MKITGLFRTDTDMYRYGGKEFMPMFSCFLIKILSKSEKKCNFASLFKNA